MANRVREIVINSRDRTEGSASSSDFTVNLTQRLKVEKLGLLSANIFFTVYNIDATNNVIDFEELPGLPLSATLTTGSYTSATLKTEIEAKMNAAGTNTYTVTFSTSLFKTTISSDGDLSLLFDSGFNAATAPTAILGYTATDKIGSSSYTSENSFNMMPVDNILLKLVTTNKTYGSVTSSNDNDNDVGNIAVIPVQVNPGYLLRYSKLDPPMTSIQADAISSMHFQLKNYDNVTINLNGTEWSMVLKAVVAKGGN